MGSNINSGQAPHSRAFWMPAIPSHWSTGTPQGNAKDLVQQDLQILVQLHAIMHQASGILKEARHRAS